MEPELADVFFGATAVCYLAASVLFIAFLAGYLQRFARWAPRLVTAGIPLHAAHIVLWSLVLHVCPVEGIHFALSVASMLACLVYVFARTRWRIDVVGAFVAPQALTFLLASRLGSVDSQPRLKSAILPFHVVSNLLGIALFTLACAAALGYLVQERRLKQKRLQGVFERLPPVEALDRAEHRFLVAGFPLLTIGILTGALWSRETAGAAGAGMMAHAALSYASWALIGGVLLLRAAAGWRGRRAALGTILGFGLTVLVLLIYLARSFVAHA